ncbi:unnamed protein product [Brassica oleracea]
MERAKSLNLGRSKEPGSQVFHARVDRHGVPFGERVSTKQTRNPPPEGAGTAMEKPSQSWKEKTSIGTKRELCISTIYKRKDS